jgi:hypothetical protein
MSKTREEELSDLEKLLAALPPRPATLNRDHLLFRAGQASMRRSWAWPLAAVVMSVAAGCLATIVGFRRHPEPVIRTVQVPVLVPAPVVAKEAAPQEYPLSTPQMSSHEAPPSTLSYWRLQQQALRFGVEGLPGPATGDTPPIPRPAVENPDLSAGSRPKLIDESSVLPFGEP